MTDEELLFRAMKFCGDHMQTTGPKCRKCPLRGNVCIDKNGIITFSHGDRGMSFVDFTEQFRKMVRLSLKENSDVC